MYLCISLRVCVCVHAFVWVWRLLFIEEPVIWLSTRGVFVLLLLLLYLLCAHRVTIFTYALFSLWLCKKDSQTLSVSRYMRIYMCVLVTLFEYFGECLADPKWIKSVYEQFRKRRIKNILLNIQTYTDRETESRERIVVVIYCSFLWMVLSCVYFDFIALFFRVYFAF